MPTAVKRLLQILIGLVIVVVIIVGGYVVYVMANYQRLGDVSLEVMGSHASQTVQTNQEYQALTWNIGFGAYADDYSFFMDECTLRQDVEGVGSAGDNIVGEYSTARNEETAKRLTDGVIESIGSLSSDGFDILLMQEVDVDSHRSYRVNQVDAITSAYKETNPQFVFANNFHTVWLHYPIFDPIGDIQSGLLTASRFEIDNAERYGYTIDESFPTKFFDLDRCFSVSYLPVEGSEAQLVVVNSHMTAYSSSNNIREQQLRELMNFVQAEYDKGNYVIIGGDFNQVLATDAERGITNWQNAEEIPTWVGTLDTALLGDDFRVVYASNEYGISTCRDSSFPYQVGENYEVVVDGFIVSANVDASATNIQENYKFSDHNPVMLTFSLQ